MIDGTKVPFIDKVKFSAHQVRFFYFLMFAESYFVEDDKMASQARIESSTEIYHVLLRGNNQNWIVKGNKNKSKFLKLLKKQKNEELIKIMVCCKKY